ncbi:MFS transporter [Deinococcus hohokamensis]|uniref:MFS transporter n=1 Tax=Deinococcus hohokamensis TaxID=309883 RepID=A0ABV9I8G1_9DEIO
MTESSAPPLLRVLAVGAVAFFTLGLIQAMYGATLPMFQARFGVETGVVGVIASAHFLGSALAPPLTGAALARLSVRRVVVACLVVLALGVSGVALAPAWGVAVGAAFVGGLGLGGVSACLNAVYAALGQRPVNLVNAVFGVGSMVSPLLVAALGARGLAWPFLTVALCAALTLLAARLWGVPGLPSRPPAASDAAAVRGLPLLFAALIGVYVSLEAGYGAWTVRYLAGLGRADAALVLSGFWGALTLGRVLTGTWGARVPPERLVLGGAALVTGCSLAALLPALAPVACVLAGLALGPAFGSLLAWATRLMPARQIPFLLMAGSAGGVVSPFVLGQAVTAFGASAVPLALMLLGAALTLLCAVMLRRTGPAPV